MAPNPRLALGPHHGQASCQDSGCNTVRVQSVPIRNMPLGYVRTTQNSVAQDIEEQLSQFISWVLQ